MAAGEWTPVSEGADWREGRRGIARCHGGLLLWRGATESAAMGHSAAGGAGVSSAVRAKVFCGGGAGAGGDEK